MPVQKNLETYRRHHVQNLIRFKILIFHIWDLMIDLLINSNGMSTHLVLLYS